MRGYEKACIDYDDYGVHYPIGVTSNKDVIAKVLYSIPYGI